MLNVYPQRNTKPQDLPKIVDNTLHGKNIEVIKNILNNAQEFDIWCAWGTLIEEKKYLKNCLKDIYDLLENKKVNWFCTGQTKDGHPEHPLYIPIKTKFKKFKVEKYI